MKFAILFLVLVIGLCQAEVQDDNIMANLFKRASAKILNNELAVTGQKPYVCNANDLVQSGTQFIIESATVVKTSFTTIYETIYGSDCPFGEFRCFLMRYTEFLNMVRSVKSQMVDFYTKSPTFTKDLKSYVTTCIMKKH